MAAAAPSVLPLSCQLATKAKANRVYVWAMEIACSSMSAAIRMAANRVRRCSSLLLHAALCSWGPKGSNSPKLATKAKANRVYVWAMESACSSMSAAIRLAAN